MLWCLVRIASCFSHFCSYLHKVPADTSCEKYPKQQHFLSWDLDTGYTVFYKKIEAEQLRKAKYRSKGVGIHTKPLINTEWEVPMKGNSTKTSSHETKWNNCRDILKYKKVKIEHSKSLKGGSSTKSISKYESLRWVPDNVTVR